MADICWQFALCGNSSILSFVSMVQSMELRPTLIPQGGSNGGMLMSVSANQVRT